MATVGEKIKEQRIALGLSQDELAKRMGYRSRDSVSKIEISDRDLKLSTVKKFAKALHCTEEYLLDRPVISTETIDPKLLANVTMDATLYKASELFLKLDAKEKAEILKLMEFYLYKKEKQQ